jgi:hypothetical protein
MQSVSSARNSSGSKSYVQAYCAVPLLVLIKHFDFLFMFSKYIVFLYKEKFSIPGITITYVFVVWATQTASGAYL